MGTCTGVVPALCCLVAGLLWTGTVIGSPDPRSDYDWENYSTGYPSTEKVETYLRILNTSENITFNVGDKKAIYCEGRFLYNDIGWYDPSGVKIEQRSNKAERIFVDLHVGSAEDPTLLALLVKDMVVTDSGTYTCRAGDLSARITIVVNDSAIGPKGPLVGPWVAQPQTGSDSVIAGPGAVAPGSYPGYGTWNPPNSNRTTYGTPGVPTWQNPPFEGPVADGPGVIGHNWPIGGPGADAPGGWYFGPIGGQSGVGGPGGLNNGPIGGPAGVGGPGGWNNGPIGGQPGVGGPGGWNNGPIGGPVGVGGPGGWNNGPIGGQPGVGGPGGWNNGPIGGPVGVGGPGGWNNGPIGGQPGVGGPGEWNNEPIGGLVGVGGPGGWNNGPIGGPVGVGGPGGWNNGPIGGPVGVGGPVGWNNGPIGGQPGVGGPGGWNNGPIIGPGAESPGTWNNGPTPLAKKEDSEKLTVGTSGSSSPQEVHFALSLVPLLHAQLLPVRLQKEADILRALTPVEPPVFYRPLVPPSIYKPVVPPGVYKPGVMAYD
ncbi:PE-PGRS family protein PE_PGRS16-like isoform X3 [Cydia pomonella]|uniref:PE-PGRS family protein PE_PGRS16-like isoform X3 n=1 Tax=Cydia pomonella TaxID=82600 RepID=UPI002ADE851A|nr:PE-PGRS family protein PE_PGRS16-like isoform X3 [Cydia pomonella]